ncbi:MAG: hypothetical protein KAJ43_09220 [Gemmatimonadetes bacterium]|nr:hypothetical protein [Gemmatimonadota bacterium]
MRTVSWSRGLAAAGAALTAWAAIDSLLGGGSASGTAGASQFLLLWVLPFATAAVFLGWYAMRGGRKDVRDAARHGCLGGLLAGGGVFLLFLVSPLFLSWDALSGAVAGFLYAPIAAVTGLLIGIAAVGMRKRRP